MPLRQVSSATLLLMAAGHIVLAVAAEPDRQEQVDAFAERLLSYHVLSSGFGSQSVRGNVNVMAARLDLSLNQRAARLLVLASPFPETRGLSEGTHTKAEQLIGERLDLEKASTGILISDSSAPVVYALIKQKVRSLILNMQTCGWESSAKLHREMEAKLNDSIDGAAATDIVRLEALLESQTPKETIAMRDKLKERLRTIAKKEPELLEQYITATKAESDYLTEDLKRGREKADSIVDRLRKQRAK